jgi:hypothetical protein
MELCDTTLEDFWPAAGSPGSASSAGRLHRVSVEHEMKRLKRALFSRDADATASLWRKNMDQGSLAGSKRLLTRSDPCPHVRLYAKASGTGWNGSNRVGGNYNGVP